MHDWEQRKLGDTLDGQITNGISNRPGHNKLNVKDINVINLYQGDKVQPDKLAYIDVNEKEFKRNQAIKGDVFLTRSSLKAEGIAKASVLLDNGNFVYDDHVMKLRLLKNFEPYFFKYLLTSFNVHKQFVSKSKTGTMTTIGQKDISNSTIYTPKLSEQEKIAKLLATLNSFITLQQKKIDKLNSFKKFLLQSMFI